MMSLTIGQLRYDLFQINENDGQGLNVDAYVLIGEKKAAVIDTLQESEALYDTVRRITDLPLVVIITHGHPDHVGKGTKQFFEAGVPVYMTAEDIGLYEDLFNGIFPGEKFAVVKENDVFDLGGVSLKTIYVPGHTPGSIVLLDEKNERLFTGDAVGSGMFWMQITGCIPLHEFRENLARLIRTVQPFAKLKIYPGHRWQSPVQLNRQYLDDTLTLTDRILEDPEYGNALEMMYHGRPLAYREASYGMMLAYSYDPENL